MRLQLKLLFAACVCLAACSGAQKGYRITGSIEGAGDGRAVLSVYSDREVVLADTVEMKGGRFEFKGETPQARNAAISVEPEGGQPASLGFILENAKISVSADWADITEDYGYRRFGDATVAGGPNQELSRKIAAVYDDMKNRPEHSEYARRSAEAMTLREEGRMDEYYKVSDEIAPLSSRYNEDVRKEQLRLIRENPDVEYGASYLNMLSRDMTLDQLEGAFNSLTEKVRRSEMAADVRGEIDALKKVQPGQPAPDFTLAQPDGTKLTLSDLRGKVVIVDFWASWCQPCRASFPAMMEFYGKYKDKGLEILGVSNDSSHDSWKKAIADDGITWMQVVDEFPIKNHPAKVATLYAIPYLPTLVLIDREGTIVAHNIEKHDLESRVNELLNK